MIPVNARSKQLKNTGLQPFPNTITWGRDVITLRILVTLARKPHFPHKETNTDRHIFQLSISLVGYKVYVWLKMAGKKRSNMKKLSIRTQKTKLCYKQSKPSQSSQLNNLKPNYNHNLVTIMTYFQWRVCTGPKYKTSQQLHGYKVQLFINLQLRVVLWTASCSSLHDTHK